MLQKPLHPPIGCPESIDVYYRAGTMRGDDRSARDSDISAGQGDGMTGHHGHAGQGPSSPSTPTRSTLPQHRVHGNDEAKEPLSPVTPKRYHRREYEVGDLASRSHDPVTATSPVSPRSPAADATQYSADSVLVPASNGSGGGGKCNDNKRAPRYMNGTANSDTRRTDGSSSHIDDDTLQLPDVRKLSVNDGTTSTRGTSGDGGGTADVSDNIVADGPIALPARTSRTVISTVESKEVSHTATETKYRNGDDGSAFLPEIVTTNTSSGNGSRIRISLSPQQQQEQQEPQSPPRPPTTSNTRKTATNATAPTTDTCLPSIEFNGRASPAIRPTRNRRYYRMAYRGVVSLLSEPDERSDRSGVYVSYGEVVASGAEEIKVVAPSSGSGGGISTAIAIRVDEVVTGGYAIDAYRPSPGGQPPPPTPPPPPQQQNGSHHNTGRDTPRRSNVTDVGGGNGMGSSDGVGASPSVCGSTFSALTASDYVSLGRHSPAMNSKTKRWNNDDGDTVDEDDGSDSTSVTMENQHGYLFLSRPSVSMPIAVGISGSPPLCQHGPFLYKVVSSTPLPVIAGPCADAPRTGQAVVMPGTIHQVSLRMQFNEGGADADTADEVIYLRLAHRRGWLTDRRSGEGTSRIVMTEVVSTDQSGTVVDGHSVSGGSVSSFLSNSLGSVTSAPRRRRRPPLRKRKGLRAAAQDPSLQPKRRINGTDPSSPQNQNGTFDYGFDCEGLGSSFGQDSKPVYPGTPVLRVAPTIAAAASPVSVLSDEEKSKLQHNLSASSSFLDRSDRYTVAHALSESTDNMAMHNSPVEPSFFLMKATAPNGLKILDAPQFQVNNLIHGQGHKSSGSTTHNKGSRPDGGFRTMAGSFANDPSILRTDSTDSASKTRIIPRGKLFEASKRLEVSGLTYTPGAGLIKLADNSGWAMVPNKEELDAQYRTFRGGRTGIEEGEATQAFKEVGNAIIDLHSINSNMERPRIWLRIIHRGGVLVSCPPPPDLADANLRSSATGSSPHSSTAGSSLNVSNLDTSSDVATSSIASSFLDAMFRTPRKPPSGIQSNDSGIGSERSRGRLSRKTASTGKIAIHVDAIIPCGLCIEVELWARDPTSQNQPSFARLRGGQGWIPRRMNGQVFTRTVDPPSIRNGSMWFRVKSKRGIKVRHGPSRRASSIKNGGGEYFRFECGEFLRASEVHTMRTDDDDMPTTTDGQGINSLYHDFECFAKLYRNSHVRSIDTEDIDYRPLNSLAAPGEWVQVYGNGRVYLEECADQPKIERHRQCWRYNAVNDVGIHVRKGPSYLSEMTGKVLRAGENVLINERVTPHGETGAWLRLKDGSGWVHEKGETGESVMIAQSLRSRSGGRPARIRLGEDRQANEAAYNTIIARLFHEHDEGSEVGLHQQQRQYR